MKLAQHFVDRPIFASVLSIVIVLLGIAAMYRLPISEYPEVVPPSIIINATYPGANPETIADTVAGPLEQEMVGIPGMLYQHAQGNSDGTMTHTLTFALGTDLDTAMIEVQSRIQRATQRLPEDVRRLGIQASKSSGSFLMVVHLFSPDGSVDQLTLANYARLYVETEIGKLPGVSDVPVFGAGEYSMRIWLDPVKMAARGLQPNDVANAIREQNVQIAPGSLAQQPTVDGAPFEVRLTARGRFAEVAEFEEVIVNRGPDGQVVRLRDVARVELGSNNYALRSLLNNDYAVALPVIQTPGANDLAVAQSVRATMERLKTSFPAGVAYEVVYDPTKFVQASIDAVTRTLLEAITLVVIVVIIFLQTWRAAIIPLVAVPVSIVGTFAVMLPFGFSINALTLFGLVLAIGIVVDDAIVVVENVERNIAEGKSPRAATRQAMREVSGPIIATALVLCSVFIPTAFISGLTGRFYQQFALTIAISTAISAFNSLTLSPALAALLLKPHVHGAQPGGRLLGWFFRGFNRAFGAAGRGYVGLTRRVIRFSAIALLVYAGLLFATWFGFARTPTAFIPQQDKGYVIAAVFLPNGASLDRTEATIREVSDIVLQHPAVDGAVAFPGFSFLGGGNQSNTGVVFVRLKDYEHRPGLENHARMVVADLKPSMFGLKDGVALVLETPPIFGLSATNDFKLFVEDRGGMGIVKLKEAVEAALNEARKRPEFDMAGGGTLYLTTTLDVPRVAIDVDRDKALAQTVRLQDIHDTLQGYFGSIYANDFNRFGRTWQVNLQADAQFRDAAADFDMIQVRNKAGEMVPITGMVTTRAISGPDRIMHYNTHLAIDVNGTPAFGFTGDQGQAAIADELAKHLPANTAFEWTELVYQQQLAGDSAIYIFPLCVLLVVLVLAAFYESLILPLAIVLIVPMCLLCAIAGVWVFSLATGLPPDNNIMTQIGLIVLVGLACKNAILIVEFAKEAEVLKGMTPVEAALDACRLRLRPILMTSLAFIAGVSPLVFLAHGAGAELRQATGVTVFAGMIGVTIFGLILTPVFYVVLRKLTGNRPFKRHDEHEQDAPANPFPAAH